MTNQLFRLIRDDHIAGYLRLWIDDDRITSTYYKDLPSAVDYLTGCTESILCDFMERGILVGDVWLFDGDLLEDIDTGTVWELFYREKEHRWLIGDMNECGRDDDSAEDFSDTCTDITGELDPELVVTGRRVRIHEEASCKRL